jgi:hypothetical protein
VNYSSRVILLSILFVSALKAEIVNTADLLPRQTKALTQRALIKQALANGKMIPSSLALKLRDGLYLLKGNGLLIDELYQVTLP